MKVCQILKEYGKTSLQTKKTPSALSTFEVVFAFSPVRRESVEHFPASENPCPALSFGTI